MQPKTPELKLVESEPGPGTGTCSRERASYEMTRGHCIIVSCGYLHSSGPQCTPATRMSIIKMPPQSNICIGPSGGRADPEFPRLCPAPRAVMMSGMGRGTSHVGTWSSQHRQHHQNLVCIDTRGGNGHIWIWSLKTDRHLALWFVVISLKCDNTKRSDVTRLMLDLDTPGASVEMGWIRVGTLLILTA